MSELPIHNVGEDFCIPVAMCPAGHSLASRRYCIHVGVRHVGSFMSGAGKATYGTTSKQGRPTVAT